MFTLKRISKCTLLIAAVSFTACTSTKTDQVKTAQTLESQSANQPGERRAKVFLDGVAERIQLAISNGDITEEQGKERYAMAVQRVDSRLASSKGEANSGERRAKVYLDGVAERIQLAIKNGDITEEEGKERYAMAVQRVGERVAPSKGKDNGAVSDDCMELRKKLGTAVRNGEITRDEAAEIWEDEGC